MQRTRLLLLACCIICRLCLAFGPITDICVAPSSKGQPPFSEHTQYVFSYADSEKVGSYDDLDNAPEDWPFKHGIWGFQAATISMEHNTKKFGESILLHAIPIHMSSNTKSIAKPRGKFFYLLSAVSSKKSSNQSAHSAVEIELVIEQKVLDDLKILSRPSFGTLEDHKFCGSVDVEHGICFGDEPCCAAFETLLSTPKKSGAKCKRILLCPKAVIKVDLTELPKLATDGMHLVIAAAERTTSSQGADREMATILSTKARSEDGSACPDGTFHVQLACPTWSSNTKNVEVDSFRECPFCNYESHRYRLVAPESLPDKKKKDGWFRKAKNKLNMKHASDCDQAEIKNRFTVEFINEKDDYMVCCVKQHSFVGAARAGSVYKEHPIEKEYKWLSGEIDEFEPRERSVDSRGADSRRDAGEKPATNVSARRPTPPPTKRWQPDLSAGESVVFSRALLIATLVTALMIVASLFIVFV